MPADNELKKLNSIILNTLTDYKSNISDEIKDYLSSKSKKLRPLLIFLLAKSLNIDITDEIYNLACSVELIHNSALIHDDIIDNAQTRRGKISLNIKLGNKMSVLAGDFLLACAFKQLVKCENINVINTFSDCLYRMCTGEINQNSSLFKVPSFDDYIKKSKDKTAELFKAGLVSLCYLSNIKEKEKISEFAINFGIAFQIKDDLVNILNTDKTKPALSDIYNGVYTAPLIYLNKEEKIGNLSEEKISKLVQNKKYIFTTKKLIEEYVLKAVKSIDFIEENQYKKEIIKITENLYEEIINE